MQRSANVRLPDGLPSKWNVRTSIASFPRFLSSWVACLLYSADQNAVNTFSIGFAGFSEAKGTANMGYSKFAGADAPKFSSRAGMFIAYVSAMSVAAAAAALYVPPAVSSAGGALTFLSRAFKSSLVCLSRHSSRPSLVPFFSNNGGVIRGSS